MSGYEPKSDPRLRGKRWPAGLGGAAGVTAFFLVIQLGLLQNVESAVVAWLILIAVYVVVCLLVYRAGLWAQKRWFPQTDESAQQGE